MTANPQVLQLELSCNLAAVPSTAQAVRRFLEAQGCSASDLADLDLALVEACNNAIQHTDPAGEARPVFIEARCDDAEVELRVLDHTPGFDWPAKATLPRPESEGGRGLYLMQSVMDAIIYSRNPSGNTLSLRKKRSSSPARPL